ncbi:MAG: CdaR family protein [Lysinibacillus sp.]
MDKMMDSPWFLRIIALCLACLLFFSVDTEPNSTDNVDTNEQVEVIKDVPVEVYYDDKILIVTGVPKTVDVTIKGPVQLVLNAKQTKDFTVFVDLREFLIGKYNVSIQHENLSEKLEVTIDPSHVDIDIDERITKEFRVDPELTNSVIDDAFTLKGMTVDPATVFITGAKSTIDSIRSVKATVLGEKGLKQSFSQVTDVRVLDRNSNKLDVTIEPAKVKVQVNISEYSKEIPIKIQTVGKAPDGVTIDSLTTDVTTLKVYGSKSIISALTELAVEVDLSKITESKTYEFEVKAPEGITKLAEQKIKVKATVTKVEEDTMSNVVPDIPTEDIDS